MSQKTIIMLENISVKLLLVFLSHYKASFSDLIYMFSSGNMKKPHVVKAGEQKGSKDGV
jgi:hypothetical protein